ncbi:unnamed protein product [Hymenolepis diminuta]|uniref:C2 domain-containing protein n=1 Tax=Hymenolepis diminuta TaxID=6216 RepID=A0A0R3SYM3_HYMDI|nr:unnamed protein product [Hymenolepis diminuta]
MRDPEEVGGVGDALPMLEDVKMSYVKAYLLPDKTKASKRKTKVKKNSTNPFYNESLIYEIARSDMAYRTLQLSVWHYRHAKANLFLGEVLVPLADYRFSSTPIWRALQNRVSNFVSMCLNL